MISPAACARWLSAAAAVVAAACASQQSYKTERLPDGTIRLECRSPLQSCLANADVLCKNAAYDVLRARDQRDKYGGELGSGQVEVRTSEAVIRCGVSEEPLISLSPGSPPPPAKPRPLPPPAPPKNVCVPGTTQACVGPGGCSGGQSCLPNGSGFGPCDCGPLGLPPAAPAGSSPPSASAAPSAAPPPSAGPAPGGIATPPAAPPTIPSAKQPRKPGPAPAQEATPLVEPRP